MVTKLTFPYISDEILTALDESFPERSADLGDDLETIMFKGGQRSVIRFLMKRHAMQEATRQTSYDTITVKEN